MRLLALSLLVAGCARTAGSGPGTPADLAPGGSGPDGGGGRDLAAVLPADLATPASGDLATASPGDAATADLASPDLVTPGRPAGQNCDQDGDCASGLCKAVVGSSPQKTCVATCKSQQDCAAFLNLFCEATAPGSADGYCVPRSPMHCASCAKDSDCGALTERCIQAPGDIAPACHVDCALAGADACPADYACAMVPDGNAMRSLCVPNGGVCLDALGGFCERIGLPQACARANNAGSCTGQRPCLMPGGRYDKCGAVAPQFKMSCADMDPAGCMEQYAPAATSDKNNCGACGKACAQGQDCCGMACTPLNTAQNCGACGQVCPMGQSCCNGGCIVPNTPQDCGACGNVCPGVGQAGGDASCDGNQQCQFTCRGENYDVDGNAANGCERTHVTPPGHTQKAAQPLGTSGCDDGSMTTFQGDILSDSRVHVNPIIDGFDGTVGSAPDYWSIVGDGSSHVFPFFCINNYGATITTSGGGNAPCYKLTITTDSATNSVVVTGNGSGSFSTSSPSQYSSNSTIFFKVEKTCSLPTQEAVHYIVQFHL